MFTGGNKSATAGMTDRDVQRQQKTNSIGKQASI